MRRVGTGASILLFTVAAGCGSVRSSPDLPVTEWTSSTSAGMTTSYLLIRGRLLADTAIVEPIFLLGSTVRAAQREVGDFTVRGTAADGALLFEVPFEPGEVADLGGVAERHFDVRVPLDERSAGRLHRLEVRSGDRAIAERTARFSAAEYEQVVASEDVVRAERVAEGQVRVRWDTDRSPMVIVMLPRTGEILTFGRGGDVIVTTTEATLEVALSDGVQSRLKVVPVG